MSNDHDPDIFDLAMTLTDAEVAALPDEVRREVLYTRELLDVLDQSWQAPQSTIDRVDRLFLDKLPPDHPWRREE